MQEDVDDLQPKTTGNMPAMELDWMCNKGAHTHVRRGMLYNLDFS